MRRDTRQGLKDSGLWMECRWREGGHGRMSVTIGAEISSENGIAISGRQDAANGRPGGGT